MTPCSQRTETAPDDGPTTFAQDIGHNQGVVFVYMQGTFDEVMERLSHRQGHFMKPSMLQSQSDILEEPGDDEIHVNVHIGQADPEHEAMAVAGALGL